jgi:c-di-GMP-binding flagellar brake protein YcgR
MAVPAAARTLIEQIGWRGADWPFIIILVVVSNAVVAGLVLAHYRKRRKESADSRRADLKSFEDAAGDIGLNDAERKMAYRLIEHYPRIRPQVFFQSITVFEKCVDAEIRKKVGERASARDIEAASTAIGGIREKAGFMYVPLEHPLVSTRNIPVGQKCSLFGKDHEKAMIQDATVVSRDEHQFAIQYRVDREELYRIMAGDEVKLVFARYSDGVYGIPLRVASSDGTGLISFHHTMDLRRNQLRQFMRMPVNLPLQLRLLSTPDNERSDIKPGQRLEAKTSDISGGGISFLSEQMLRPGDMVSLTFSLPSIRCAGISCRILRISLQEGKTKSYYRHHGEFSNIDQRRRDAIVRYVLEKQRQAAQWR